MRIGLAVACSGALLLGLVSPALAQDPERMAMSHVRLTTDASVAARCTRVTFVSDDSLKDLRRKIVRVGGDTAVLSFRSDDLSVIQAEVFRCPVSAPAQVPPPPKGVPPPPPAGPTR